MKLNLSNSFDLNKAKTYFEKLAKNGAKIELKKYMEIASVDQFRYLHVCLSIFCLHTGYTVPEAKEIFAEMLPELLSYRKKDRKFRKSTNDLNEKEISEFIDYIRSFCNDQLGVYVPTNIEYKINRFAIEREIENVK